MEWKLPSLRLICFPDHLIGPSGLTESERKQEMGLEPAHQ